MRAAGCSVNCLGSGRRGDPATPKALAIADFLSLFSPFSFRRDRFGGGAKSPSRTGIAREARALPSKNRSTDDVQFR